MDHRARATRRRVLLLALALLSCAALAGVLIAVLPSDDAAPDTAAIAQVSDGPSAAPSGSAAPSEGVTVGKEQAGAGRAGPSTGATPRVAARSTGTPVRSTKKGASTWKGVRAALGDVGAGWYYNWTSGPSAGGSPAGVEFVPMIWGTASLGGDTMSRLKGPGPLLGFNEPDFAAQSNMSPERALELWPRLQATGRRLGSPAPAVGAATPGGWLDRFMTGAKAKGYRVDFIALHWYGGDFRTAEATGQLRSYLQDTWARYHKPIWLTEYALINFGGGQKYPDPAAQAAFVRSSTRMMEGLSYVERYAWFSLPTPDEGGDGTGLYRSGTTTTPAGAAYRSAG